MASLLPEYSSEHKKSWDGKYAAGRIVGDRLVPALVSGGATLAVFYASHDHPKDAEDPSDVPYVDLQKVGGAFLTASLLKGLLSDTYEFASYRLGFTPSIYRLGATDFSKELEILSLWTALSYIIPAEMPSGEQDKHAHVVALNLLDPIRVVPARRSVISQVFSICKSAITDPWQYYRSRGYDGLADSDLRSAHRGIWYLTQLNKAYRNLPSFNLNFPDDYDKVIPGLSGVIPL